MKRLAILTLTLAISGCGSGVPRSEPANDAPAAAELPDIASSDPRVQYFHEQLVNNGEDTQSAFGSDLTTLGLSPRDLQQDDPQHAYDTVLEHVRKVEDAALRREMMRTFFNVTEP